MKQPKKSKVDTSPIIITTEFTREEIERFSEEWTKLMHKQQPIMIHKDADVEPINVEPTTKKEINKWIEDSYQCKEFIQAGGLIKKDRERAKTHIKVFITKTNKFRAQISEPNKPMYEVTVGGVNWNKGIGKEHIKEIETKCRKLLEDLTVQLIITLD